MAPLLSVGTVDYMAPERNGSHQYGLMQEIGKGDVWSLGIILYKLTYGYLPAFSRRSPPGKLIDTYVAHSFCTLEFPAEGGRVSDACIGLMQKMLTKDPKDRPVASELFEEPWIAVQEVQGGQTMGTE